MPKPIAMVHAGAASVRSSRSNQTPSTNQRSSRKYCTRHEPASSRWSASSNASNALHYDARKPRKTTAPSSLSHSASSRSNPSTRPKSWRKGAVVATILINVALFALIYLGWHFDRYPTPWFLGLTTLVAFLDVVLILPYRLYKANRAEIATLKKQRDDLQDIRAHEDTLNKLSIFFVIPIYLIGSSAREVNILNGRKIGTLGMIKSKDT